MSVMSKPVIEVQGVSKEYIIGSRDQTRETFREMLTSSLAAPFRRLRRLSGSAEPEGRIWALKDVSFAVDEGDVVGIIGRNGAGKSTLLKILSRITAPTEGRVTVRGRVASLLEVGTGFHRELTGRENIQLNGAILGMTGTEIRRKFDEIVDFSGVEKFLDTPVKRYSSGMKVRLAFAVAAHLDPEILMVDEVLAVGDADFQRKCLRKMSDVARVGRTVLFVSHNMAAVENLCTRGCLIASGRLMATGKIGQMIQIYMSEHTDQSGDVDAALHPCRVIHDVPVIQRFSMLNGRGSISSQFPMGERIVFEIHLSLPQAVPGLEAALRIYDRFGQRVTTLRTANQTQLDANINGTVILRCKVPYLDLMPGIYSIVVGVDSAFRAMDRIDPVTSFEILPADVFGTGRMPHAQDGVFFSRGEWEVEAA